MDKIFVCDLDGVLLNTQKGFSKKWSELLGTPIPESAFIHWDHALSLGVPKALSNRFWDEFWQDTPLDPYPGAGIFINSIKYLGYKIHILTSRSSNDAASALWRDIVKLRCNGNFEIDDVIVCDHRKENKSSYINKIQGAQFFLDDHVKNVVDVQLRSEKLSKVMLFNQSWNTSSDIMGYLRVYSYGHVLSVLSKYPS